MQQFRLLCSRRLEVGTSSTKPEVHNVSQRRQWSTESRRQSACRDNLVKFGRVVFEICEQTDRQRDRQTKQRHTHHNTSNKKHLKNVGPIRHCEPPHAHSPGVPTVARAHRCPRQRRRRRRRQRQRQRVTEGTAMNWIWIEQGLTMNIEWAQSALNSIQAW